VIARPGRSADGRPGKARAGRSAGPEAAGEVLARLLRDLRLRERNSEGALAAAWEKAAGGDLSGRARPVAFRRGLLTVEVEGAPLLQEVRGFRARSLLEVLRGLPGGEAVREIRFVPAGRPDGRGGS
jgi:hypothetical protein